MDPALSAQKAKLPCAKKKSLFIPQEEIYAYQNVYIKPKKKNL